MKTWKDNQQFFRGVGERPISEAEKFCIYALAGATILLCAVRLYQHTIIWF